MDVYISQNQSVYTEDYLDIDPESYKKYLNGKDPSIESLKDYIDKYSLIEADSSCYAEEYTDVFLDYLRIDDTEELFEEVKRLQRKEYGSSI